MVVQDRTAVEVDGALAAYRAFLKRKICLSDGAGFPCDPSEVSRVLKDFQRDVVAWAVQGGRRALFESFGLGKTMQQLEVVRLTLAKAGGGRGLIIMPLGVRQEFMRDAATLGLGVRFIRTTAEASADGVHLTNYESVREGKIDPRQFTVVSLDEAGILRGFGGTKTFREFMATISGDDRRDLSNPQQGEGVPYRFVATATPSPNDYIELLAYSAFLGIMDVSAAKTRFFRRDSQQADHLTLHPHKEREFWLWVSSWAIFVEKPSDLGYSDEGYELPPLDIRWHEVATDHSRAGMERDGQHRLIANAALGVVDAAREKRESLPDRLAKLLELRAEDPDAHRVIWHDLEAERRGIKGTIPDVVTIYGSQGLDERERAIIDFAAGHIREVACKPVMLGSGVNFQRHCSWAIYLGIGFKFNDFIQSIYRLQRFGQPNRVRIDIIYTEAERDIRAALEEKWAKHRDLVAQMTHIIREYGLSKAAVAGALTRSLGVERQEASGQGWTLINNDCVEETHRIEVDTVDLILTSIPFSTQYEYSPSYNDFGHTNNARHFWEQMDFLTPQLLRVLKPGRNLVIHCKDRIVPGGITGLGFQTVQPFHAEAIFHYARHGFAYLGMKTIVTDVVRENNQTYRLGWTEQCKDGSRMGCGMPEYLLIFRKPTSDPASGYADEPVVKSKADYSRARWQVDAHGFARSNGNRLLSPEDLIGVPHEAIFKLFRKWTANHVYDYETHVAIGEALERERWLPTAFMLLQPASWHPDVWTDIARMRSLNGAQHAKGREMHLCPLPFDIVDRVITQMSMPGELVMDPFSGLGTVPLQALKLRRRGLGIELSPAYHADAVYWLKTAKAEANMPTLFDLLDGEVSA